MLAKIFRRYKNSNLLVAFGLLLVFLTPLIYKESQDNGRFNSLFSGILYISPLVFLLTGIRNRIFFISITVLVTIVSFIETMMVVLYGNYLTAGNIISILNTTTDEGGGFVVGVLPKVYEAFPVLLGGIAAIFVHRGKTHVRYNLVLCTIFTMLSCLFLFYQLKIRWAGNLTTRFYVEQNVLSKPPYNSIFQSINAADQLRNYGYIVDADTMTYGAQRPSYDEKESYVLYIGESLRYNNLSLAGYHRSTTPLLESLDNVTIYSNYYSTATLTMYSVPQIITRATADNYVLNFKEKSVFKPFQECGFKTFVICSSNLLAYEKYLSQGCDSLFVFDNSDDKMAFVVDSLVNIYPKTFFIVQGVGNHGPYSNFTSSQDKYHPNPVSDKVGWDNHDAMVNAYDNTVLHTDFNVHSIIRAIDKSDMQSAFILVSDHGADYDTGVSDHGGNCNPGINEYHVPLIFWHSHTWGDNHQEKKRHVLANKDLPVNADNVFYSVCDMADITILRDYAQPEWSIFSKRIKLHDRKILVPDGKNYIVVK